MIETIFGITWGAFGNIFIVIPLLIVATLCIAYRIKKSNKTIASLASSQWSKQILAHFSPIKNGVKAFLFILGLGFLSITLLHPQWDKKEQTIAQEGRDLFIALDVSRSMLAKDCLPSRLECAKSKIKELVKRLSSER